MFFLNTFFHRITSDFRQKELMPLKLLFFVHASTLYVLYPYLTIHMRELGINVEEVAIMSAVTPIVAIVMPPIAGVVADRIGNFKFLLSVFNALGGATSLLLLLVPVGRVTFTYPEQVLLDLQCSPSGTLFLSSAEDYPCKLTNDVLKSQIPNGLPVSVAGNLEACGLICERDPTQFTPALKKGPTTLAEELSAILRTRSYTVVVQDEENNTTNNYHYTLSASDLPLFRTPNPEDKDARNNRNMKTAGHFPTSVRKLNGNQYFFPASGLYNFSCSPRDSVIDAGAVNNNSSDSESGSDYNISCFIERTSSNKSSSEPSSSYIITSPNKSGGRLNLKIKSSEHINLYKNNMNMFIIDKINMWQEENRKFTEFQNGTCANQDVSEKESVFIPLLNPENSLEVDSVLPLDKCRSGCLVTVERSKLCTNLDTTVEYDIRLTFWQYLVIRVFIGMISGTAFAMFEGAVIAILREHKADYGLQRIYAAIGGMISSPLSGMLIDYASQNKGYTDFRPAFYLYAGLKIISGALMLTINLEFKTPATNVVSDVLTVLKNIEIVALFITCFILGTAWGYIESFLFWLLQDLGASRSLMGITITIGGIAGLPLLVMSGPIIDKIGHANVLFIGFIFYAIRLLGYSLIYNPWMCLIFEAMESVTSSLAITAAVTYAAKLSTNTTDSSIQGLLGGLYFGVGKGAGSLIGGFLMQAVGTRPTYQIFSAVTLVTGCIYYIFNYMYIERRRFQREKGGESVKGDQANSIFDKQLEAKDRNIGNYNSIAKEGNHVIENIPLNSTSNTAKKYTINCDQGKPAKILSDDLKKKNDFLQNENSGAGKTVTTLPSCHINLGFENDDENRLRNRRQSIEDSRNKEKR